MDATRRFFFGPTPEEQRRECNRVLRSNARKLEQNIQRTKKSENDAKNLILQSQKRAQRNPSQQKQAAAETRIFARELIRARKQTARLVTSQATLESVRMQVEQAYRERKIQGSIKTSTEVMKNVNSLVRLPELTSTMRELSQELMKAGIIEEMVGDAMEADPLEEDEETEAEIDKVLGDVLKTRVSAPETQLPSQPVGPVQAQPEEEEEEFDSEEMLAQMRGRLEALKS